MALQLGLPGPPRHIAARLPGFRLLADTVLRSTIELPSAYPLVRAAWNPRSVWPMAVNRTYRFGPPDQLLGVNARYPFHWVYMADHVITAVWEAQFCGNDVTHPGTFYIKPGAAEALLAALSFNQPLRLLDLTGANVSKLGIFDELRGPDYEFCQWLGLQLDCIVAGQGGAVHGIRYASRKHPGANAYALSSRVMSALATQLLSSAMRFGDSEEFMLLSNDVCCVPAP